MKATPRFPRYEVAFLVLCGIFLVSLVVANIIAVKLFVLSGIILSAGIIPYPVTFLCTDLVSEVYGSRRANVLVLVGFGLSLYVLFLLNIGQVATPLDGKVQSAYDTIFGGSSRAIIASMIAYLVAQLLDVRLFHYWKNLTDGKHLWLRNNGSTLISQMIDTVLVVSILFYDTLPVATIIQIIIAGYLFKLIIALVDTPLFYFGTKHFGAWVEERPVAKGELRRDTTLAITSLGGVSLLVGGGIAWDISGSAVTYGFSTGSGIAVLVCGAAVVLLSTIGLARADYRNKAALAAAAGGLCAAVMAFLHDGVGNGPQVALWGGVLVVLAGVITALGDQGPTTRGIQ